MWSGDTVNIILWANKEVFTIAGAPAESVGSFRHLGRVESSVDSDGAAVHTDLMGVHCKWCKLSKIL